MSSERRASFREKVGQCGGQLGGLFVGQSAIKLACCAALCAVQASAWAQLGNLQDVIDIPDPNTSLPEPSALVRYTLESPLPLAIMLAVMGIVAALWLSARDQRRRGVRVGLGLFAAGCVAWAVGHFVETPRESASTHVKHLIGTVATADLAGLDRALTPACELRYFQAPAGIPKAAILALAEASFAKNSSYAIAEHRIERMEVYAKSPTSAQAQVKVWVKGVQWPYPHRSWWRLDLVRSNSSAEWQTDGILNLSIQGVTR
jgi:hypothetical protein